MVNSCCIVGCTNRASPRSDITFSVIPAIILHQGEKTKQLSQKRRDLWISRINRKGWKPTANSRVCSIHFHKGKPASLATTNHACNSSVQESLQVCMTQLPDWAPSLHLGYAVSQTPSQERYERTVQQEKRRRIDSTDDDLPTGVACQTDYVEIVSTGCQTDDDFMNEYTRLKSENENLKKENECLTMKLAMTEETVLSCECLKDNDDLLKFYTGIVNQTPYVPMIPCHVFICL